MDAYQAALHAAHPDACPEVARTGSRGVDLEESRDAFFVADAPGVDVDAPQRWLGSPPPSRTRCSSTQIDLADVRRKLGPKYGIHTALRIVGLWRVSLVIKKTKEETSVERGFPQSTIDTLQVLYSGVLVHSET